MSTPVPTLGNSIHYLLPIRDHPAQIPLALTLQSLVPLIGSVSDDPVVFLLQNPLEIRSVIVPICRCIAHKTVQQNGCFVVLEYKCGVVEVQICRERIVGGIEAGGLC